eukprot:473842-Pyramimonas_sp.AAC.1
MEDIACASILMYQRDAGRMLRPHSKDALARGGRIICFSHNLQCDCTPLKTTIKDLEDIGPSICDT